MRYLGRELNRRGGLEGVFWFSWECLRAKLASATILAVFVPIL